MAALKNAWVRSPSERPLLGDGLIADKYRIDEQIAEGGMGVVYRATHLDLDQPVAIKVVRPDLAHSELVIARFLNEARAAARLRGLHVARVLDAGRLYDGLPYLVMEFLEGADLSAVLTREGPLPVGVAVDYVLQACQAVAEAHAAGIIHRDLKPENLFLTTGADGAPVVKVLDFGISKQLAAGASALTNPSCGIGSPHYMAPEQMRAPESVDQRADVWSLGAVLYELLTGNAPFDGESLPVVCARVLGEEPTPLGELRTDVTKELEAAVSKALEKERSSRHPSVAEFAKALENALTKGRRTPSPLAAPRRAPVPLLVKLPPASPTPAAASSVEPVCSVRIRDRFYSDSTPAPHVDSIRIAGRRRSRAPAVATIVACAAVAGYVSARGSDVGMDAAELGHWLGALAHELVDASEPPPEAQSAARTGDLPASLAAPATLGTQPKAPSSSAPASSRTEPSSAPSVGPGDAGALGQK